MGKVLCLLYTVSFYIGPKVSKRKTFKVKNVARANIMRGCQIPQYIAILIDTAFVKLQLLSVQVSTRTAKPVRPEREKANAFKRRK
jgi:ABC-type enterochelin transport system permease subunit